MVLTFLSLCRGCMQSWYIPLSVRPQRVPVMGALRSHLCTHWLIAQVDLQVEAILRRVHTLVEACRMLHLKMRQTAGFHLRRYSPMTSYLTHMRSNFVALRDNAARRIEGLTPLTVGKFGTVWHVEFRL